MTETRDGMPLKPGEQVPANLAEGLVGPEALANAPTAPAADKDKILSEELASALPQPGDKAAERPAEYDEASTAEGDPNGLGRPPGVPESVCPKCGWNCSQKFEIDPSPLDRANFMRAALTAGRFTKSYDMFGGRLRVTFRSRLVEESEDIAKHLQWEATRGNMDIRLLYVIANKMNMAMSIQRIEIFNEDGTLENTVDYPIPNDNLYPQLELENENDTDQSMCHRVHHKLFVAQNVSEMTYNAVYRAFTMFDSLYEMLVARADDPDFWSATPSAT